MVFLNLLALVQPTVQTDLNSIAFFDGLAGARGFRKKFNTRLQLHVGWTEREQTDCSHASRKQAVGNTSSVTGDSILVVSRRFHNLFDSLTNSSSRVTSSMNYFSRDVPSRVTNCPARLFNLCTGR